MQRPPVGFKEEITDILTKKGVQSGEYKKGQLLKFSNAKIAIKITRIDRKNGRAWGEHVETMVHNTALGHYRHNIDQSDEAIKKYRTPYCEDCEVPINQEANASGKKKAQDREDSHLEDGTPIN